MHVEQGTDNDFLENFTLNANRVKEFAARLYYSGAFISDVKAYIAEHQAEYEKFLGKEREDTKRAFPNIQR